MTDCSSCCRRLNHEISTCWLTSPTSPSVFGRSSVLCLVCDQSVGGPLPSRGHIFILNGHAARCGKNTLASVCVDRDEGKLQAFLHCLSLSIWCRGRFSSSVAWSTQCKNSCKVFNLLRNPSWSQVSTEQWHSAASAVMKKHRTLGHQMLQTRSLLGQLRCLFVEPVVVRKLRKREVL